MMFVSTAIYPNRLEDKEKLETSLLIKEEGDVSTAFYLPDNSLFSIGYERIVYGDHGPYIEFAHNHIKCKMFSRFGNVINRKELPKESKYYYYWLYPQNNYDIKVYLQIKPVHDLPNAPKRLDGKQSSFNRKEGYADYKRGYFYVDPYVLTIKKVSNVEINGETCL
jgi:hypothetical protein